MEQPEGHRIGLCVSAELIHEAFVSESILNPQRRPEWPSEKWRTHGMSQGAFATDGSIATTVAGNTPCEIGWHRVALVAKLSGRRPGRAGLRQLRRISQQHTGDDVPRLIVARSIAHRSDPVLTIPGDDASILREAGTKLHRAR